MVKSAYFSYMKKHGLIRYVSLEEMAKNYERTSGSFPTVIVDISDVDTHKYINTLVPYPWNYHTLVKILTEYVRQFRDKHIEPCFYIWGRLKDYVDVKMPNKYKSNKKNGLKKLEEIRDNRHSDSTCYAENTLSKIYWFSSFILKYECGCQVINVTEKKYAKLAKIVKDDDRCLGILTSDPGYFIYNTKPVFYHVPMKLVSTLTEMYLPNEFLRKIDLNSSQLKLLFCAQKDLLGFKFANLENDEVLRIEYLRNAIKDNNLTGDKNDFSIWSYVTDIRIANLRAKAELYDEIDDDGGGSANYTTLSKLLKQKWIACEIPAKVYYVVKRRNYVETFNLSDFIEESLPFSISLYASMRRNMYFALLRQENCRVRELWISEPANINIEDYVTNFTAYKGFTPSLETLLSNDSSVNEYRWKLLLYCLGRTTCNRYANTPIFAFCCVINYMLRNGVEFRQYELDALILQAILVSNNSDSYNNNTEWNRRFVHLSRLYETGMNTLMNVLTACGFPISLEHSLHWKTFNILVFSNVYYELKCPTPVELFCRRNNIDISYYKWICITCLEK
ncbi:uncharacterized protein LOC111633217 [Centruroides sculpturatus]|uniref:uncharacterized protein LOC111633217 n=1 Tax=Centruroides sculpturatus TaxID=218467 RepID=UPI000C6E471A|nr:uncharacterized protein LOC111633217 [Centruroides sculpturatus]XP_023233521.1 uncharacterized protein LOC111633217 [Centruroides sculpturatus]XP_023233522.1 uncharacterized protein LOC111633217 [Centruroides sculpturatus]